MYYYTTKMLSTCLPIIVEHYAARATRILQFSNYQYLQLSNEYETIVSGGILIGFGLVNFSESYRDLTSIKTITNYVKK